MFDRDLKTAFLVITSLKRAAEPARVVLLRWTSADPTKVTFDNAPLHELLQPGSEHPSVYSYRHFEHLYHLVENGIPSNEKLPIPVPADPSGGDLLCPPDTGKP